MPVYCSSLNIQRKLVKIVLFFFIAFISSPVWANENKDRFLKSPVAGFLLLEGLAAINSGIAAANPEVFGGAMILLSPLAANSHDNVVNAVSVGSALTLGTYNLIEFKDARARKKSGDISRGEIFWKNMVASHILVGAIGTVTYLRKKRNRKTTFNAIPMNDGLFVLWVYRFQ